ncbi:MAG: TRAP transporter small permease [Rhodobacteraceae bacterium]|nr:TRAP transporter small permease [Paracoccaceae bacterium]
MMAIRKIADRLTGLSASVGAIGLLFEVVVILIDVIGRALGQPLYGSQDLITMTMVIVVFGAMALCDRKGGHISVDLFEKYYPPLMNRVIDVISALAGAVIFVGLAWAVYDSAKLSVMLNLSTNLLNIPKAWIQWVLIGFALITALGMLLRAIELTFDGEISKGDKVHIS